MPFDESPISNIAIAPTARQLVLSWDSSAPSGTHHQVYADGRLMWSGTDTKCVISSLPDGRAQFCIGTVGADESYSNFADSLPEAPWKDKVTLDWFGGTYLGDDIAGFNIYRGSSTGEPVDYTSRIGSVAAYPQGRILDGAGIGCAGYGVAGRAASNYWWKSGSLATGTWNFGIRPVSSSGVEGPTTEIARVVAAPPTAPARGDDGKRLSLSGYDSTSRVATLSWLPSS